ncbi:GNAT family protein [Flavobacterium sp.]|uniref:GNAT family N-acetyltransferase n=1 Tax=Flavobacterium sp. TaxID=239 RepID=UPI002629B822|nr:GNAT family protein [Flavobacterium sp.]MDD2985769.1 GNAT family protein [Flavobacterium sp.]
MLSISFSPFPILESKRLLLRAVTIEDVNEVLSLRGNSENMKFIPRPLITSKEMAMEHIAMIIEKIEQNLGINWAITLKGSPKMIGIIGHYRIQPENYRSEIGYMLLPEFQNQGITSEAIYLTLDYGFNQLNFHSIEAVVDPENSISAKVLEKNGFVKEAHFLENEYWDGKFWDSVVYSILKKNFNKSG